MGSAIGWFILGIIYYIFYKRKKDYFFKISSKTFIIIGIIAFIISLINRLFFKSGLLECCILALLIPTFAYIYYKMKQYSTGLKIADKLTEK